MLNQSTKPEISVVLPFYNAKDFLVQAVDSILNQTFTNFELILIDDVSNDGSSEIAKDYQKDLRVKYYRNDQRLGIAGSLNKGIGLSQADFIARMDGDDIAMPERFQKQFDFLKHNSDISVVGSFVKIINEQGEVIDHRTKLTNPSEIKKNILTYSPFVHPAVMFRKADILKAGGYKTGYGVSEDVELWSRLACLNFQLANIPEFLLKYRYHKNSTAHNAKKNAWDLYRLRQDTIKNYKLKVSWSTKIMVLLQLLIGLIFTGRQRQFIEKTYKIIRYHAK